MKGSIQKFLLVLAKFKDVLVQNLKFCKMSPELETNDTLRFGLARFEYPGRIKDDETSIARSENDEVEKMRRVVE